MKVKNSVTGLSRALKSKWLWLVGVIILLGIILWGWRNGDVAEADRFVVASRDLVEEVSVIGSVTPATEADLAFEESGRVVAIPASIGQNVAAGDPLVHLSLGTLAAERQSAQAELVRQRAQNQSSEINLAEIQKEQDALVASAERKLLSDALAAVPLSEDYTVSPPTITGTYLGPQGTYKFRVMPRGQVTSAREELRVFGLETVGPVNVLESEPTPLGTRGLFIDFPDSLDQYRDTTWYVTIPNPKSANYLDNFNAYEEARKTRSRVIAEAEESLAERENGMTVVGAELAQAEAELARVDAEIAKRTLRSPIAGVVTKQEATLGELVSAGEIVSSVISLDNFEIEAKVPESDIAKIKVGDKGAATLDAYGDSASFAMTVKSIDPAETVVEDISTYKIVLAFDVKDDRILSGMTANVNLITGARDNVLAIPSRAVTYDDEGIWVEVLNNDKWEKRQVTLGLASSDGFREVLTGLVAGEIVNSNPL